MNTEPFEIGCAAFYIKDAQQYIIDGIGDLSMITRDKSGYGCSLRNSIDDRHMYITKSEWENDFISFKTYGEYMDFKKTILRDNVIVDILK